MGNSWRKVEIMHKTERIKGRVEPTGKRAALVEKEEEKTVCYDEPKFPPLLKPHQPASNHGSPIFCCSFAHSSRTRVSMRKRRTADSRWWFTRRFLARSSNTTASGWEESCIQCIVSYSRADEMICGPKMFPSRKCYSAVDCCPSRSFIIHRLH